MYKASVIFFSALFLNCSNKVDTSSPEAHILNGETYNFGDIYLGDTLKHSFVVKNNGTSGLNIENVQSGCSCTTSKISSTKIEPGFHSEIEIDFIPNKEDVGLVDKLVVVKTNGRKKITLLHMVGNVINK